MSTSDTKTKKSTVPKGIDRCTHFTGKEERCKLKKVASSEYCHIHTEKPNKSPVKEPKIAKKSTKKEDDKIIKKISSIKI